MKERFLSKVEIKDSKECWEWKAAYRGKYGAFKFNNKNIDAHRVSYLLFKGDIPKNMYVCHTCDNPKCVNPNHLFLGTHSDNMKDAFNKGRLNIPITGQFKKGHKAINSNLSNEQVINIKLALNNRTTSLKDLAKLLNIPYQTIRDINCGRAYNNISSAPPLNNS